MLLKVCRLIRCTQSPMHSPQPQTHGTSAHSGSRCVHKHALTSSANYTASRPPLLPRQARRERFVDTQAARCALSYRSVRWSRVIHAPPKVYNVSVRSRSRPRIRIGQAKAQQTSRSTTDQVNGTGAGGSNGWAWLFGSLTLSAGTGLPALYIGSHFDEVCLPADSCNPLLTFQEAEACRNAAYMLVTNHGMDVTVDANICVTYRLCRWPLRSAQQA